MPKKRLLILFIFSFLLLTLTAESASIYNLDLIQKLKIRPPLEFKVYDTPDDNGGSLTINWRYSPDDNLWGNRSMLEKYLIGRRVVGTQKFEFINTATAQSNSAFDNSVNNKDEYEYVVAAYPIKYIFRPIPWSQFAVVNQVEHLKYLAPWMGINSGGVLLNLLNVNYDYYYKLDGYKSDLAQKSLWENFSTGDEMAGPVGLAPSLMVGELYSPLGGFIHMFVHSSLDGDFYQYSAMGKYLGEGLMAVSEISAPVKAHKSWLNISRVNVLILAFILCFFILFYINQAKSGKELFIRKIAGLDAVEEAVGRATEMGKEIFFIPGTQDMENIQTIAGVIILGRVARLTAELETKLEVPVSRSLVMVTAREIVKEAYMNAGRPEAFREDMVHYLTDDQFGYAAAIDGKMVRQKPATIFYMGAFYAESLILAETGNSIGAIQIAGTAMPAQLPFFVAACDYTLIGEELFAASAYLSREPKLLGSLKGQDIGKAVLLVALAVGVIVQTFGWFDFASLFSL